MFFYNVFRKVIMFPPFLFTTSNIWIFIHLTTLNKRKLYTISLLVTRFIGNKHCLLYIWYHVMYIIWYTFSVLILYALAHPVLFCWWSYKMLMILDFLTHKCVSAIIESCWPRDYCPMSRVEEMRDRDEIELEVYNIIITHMHTSIWLEKYNHTHR